MKLKDFDYYLPKNLIAQRPIKPRDHSRLLVLNKQSGETKHRHFYNIIDYLEKGDVLVLNNSKVFPARLLGKKAKTGGKIEVFLLQKTNINSKVLPLKLGGDRVGMEILKTTPAQLRLRANSLAGGPNPSLFKEGSSNYQNFSIWNCLLGGHGRRVGLGVEFNPEDSGGLKCKVIKNNNDGTWEVKFNKSYKKLMEIVEKIGKVPLPPYIKRSVQSDEKDYQTIYADEKKIGSVAAPTAGFHFTPGLIRKLKKKGVQFEYITLHVGLGTFAPVKTEDITKHKMHAEWVEVKEDVAERIVKAKKEGRRIVAVGTTSVRILESVLSIKRGSTSKLEVEPLSGLSSWTDMFIYPGYKFRVVDAMITNFHLPKSTLLMLVCAFAGKKNIDIAYKEAIKKKYRFYSYGDAMLIF